MKILLADTNRRQVKLLANDGSCLKMTAAGKLGFIRWEMDELFRPAENGTSGMIGVDLKYDFWVKVSVVISAEHYGGIDENVGTLNFRYTFK